MRLLLVDDDALITESLAIILSKEPDFEVIGTCVNGAEAVAFVKDKPVDLILMDIRMPVMDGIEACAKIKSSHPDVKVVMLTTFRDFRHVHQALHAGASGYVLKSDSVKEQIETIKHAASGKAVISTEALEAFTRTKSDDLLTARENSCMELIAHGYANKEIAARLYIGEGTVRNVISTILDKLHLRDRTQIAIYYWQSEASKNTF
ncbi:MAG: DNA-binding response regulator [Acholeplasmatales bacterium]|nr:MAG: DNA-binding response regulator [Acholeplasmatales bacterium]